MHRIRPTTCATGRLLPFVAEPCGEEGHHDDYTTVYPPVCTLGCGIGGLVSGLIFPKPGKRLVRRVKLLIFNGLASRIIRGVVLFSCFDHRCYTMAHRRSWLRRGLPC